MHHHRSTGLQQRVHHLVEIGVVTRQPCNQEAVQPDVLLVAIEKSFSVG